MMAAVGELVIFIVVLCVFAFGLGVALSYLWSWTVVSAFGWPALGVWQATGLVVMITLLGWIWAGLRGSTTIR